MKDGVKSERISTRKHEEKTRSRVSLLKRDRDSVPSATVVEHGPLEPESNRDVGTKRQRQVTLFRRLGKITRNLPVTKISPLLWSIIGLVLVPSLASIIYFAFIASDQLIAEARFTVRQIESDAREPQSQEKTHSTTNLSASYSFGVSGQNAYIVTSYIESRAIVDDLNKRFNLRELFRRPEADFWMRLKDKASIEDLTDYWKSMVTTYTDTLSGIVTLRVRAFRSEDAVLLARNVLELSEDLVNRISDRARRDAMSKSEEEVRRAFEMTRQALGELRKFRDSAGIIDPVQSGTEIGKLLLELLTERIRLESELFVANRNMNDSAPTVRALKIRLESAEQQIADLKGRLTSTQGDQTTLAAALVKFEELELQRQFAEKLYTMARTDLDRARQRADRQSLYLTVFVPPSLPEESRYPRRAAFPLLIFVGLLVLWAIGAMTLASIEDHRL